MKYGNLHPWNVSPQEASRIQTELAKKIILEKKFREVKRIAGADISFSGDRAYAGVIIFSFPDLRIIEKQQATAQVSFPYIPGLLAFREGPALLSTFEKVEVEPDLIIFDAQGLAHPRRMGLATHLGIILDMPSIGCAKSRLVGSCQSPGEEVGAYSLLEDGGETIGAVVRTKEGVKPIFVSIGHKTDLESSIKMVLDCGRGYRLPEPSRLAHNFAEEIKGGKVDLKVTDEQMSLGF
ncbi:deoxyribonuclease V [candidate division NPL-UPA2 bacterium]|nr:deoxyribonuclease V [candidate division NPL-UPA2 bacterium]